jgi:hypothetical protein
MVGFELFEQAQGEFLFTGIVRVGQRGGRPLLFGDALLCERLLLFVPGTELGGGLIEGKAYRQGDFGRDSHQKDEALSPERAATFFIAQFVEMG